MSNFFSSGHALLVGVGADLPATARDAAALNELLIDPNRAAYPEEQVRLLAGTAACREGILCAFDQLIGQVNQRPGEATVVIYFSGHGGRIEQNDGAHEYFLVPYGYNPERRAETAISGAEFTAKIEALQPRKLVVMLDCCHAGGVPKIVKDVKETFVKSPAPPDLLDKLGQGSGRVVIASSHEGEKSYISGTHSIFTECLLEAMAGKASVDKDGYARILDTLIYLFRHVPDRAEPYMQHPFVKKVLNLGDNFPLCYYAGGSKSVPGGKVPSSVQGEDFKPTRRRRLKRKYEDIQELYEIQREKVKRMRKQLVIAVDAATTFKLEQQLLDEEARLAHFESELNQIELMLE